MNEEGKRGDRERIRLVLIGALPPPYMGPTKATQLLLQSRYLADFDIAHLDISDHRELSTLGLFDIQNVIVAVRSYLGLVKLLVQHRAHVVYMPLSQTTLGYLKDSIYILITKLLRRRVVCHLRGGYFRIWLRGATKWTQAYVRWVQSLVDAQLVLGHCLLPLFEGLVPGERLHVVANGMDIEPLRRESRPKGRVSALFLANLLRDKGIMEALEGAALARQQAHDLEFSFAGAWVVPETKDAIEKFLAAQETPFRYLGCLGAAEKRRAFSEADIFVFPSYHEGHPWVIVEAMAAGLPIIATDAGAIGESVEHGVNGFIVDKRNAQQVAERLVELALDEPKRARMGAASRRLYEERFTEEKTAASLAEVLHQVVEETDLTAARAS